MKPNLEQIIADLQKTMPLTRRDQVVEAAKSVMELFEIEKNWNNDQHPIIQIFSKFISEAKEMQKETGGTYQAGLIEGQVVAALSLKAAVEVYLEDFAQQQDRLKNSLYQFNHGNGRP